WEARNERKRLEAQLREDEPVIKPAPMAAEKREPAKPALRERIFKREEAPAPVVEPREPTLGREPVVPPREAAREPVVPRETVVPREQHAAP
ncbi:cell division protein FtsK, partial [Pseudomonas sp. SIMBA_068]